MASINLNPVIPVSDYPLGLDISTFVPAPPTRIPVLKGAPQVNHVLKSVRNVNSLRVVWHWRHTDLEIASHAVNHHDIKIISQAAWPKRSQIDKTGTNSSQMASPSAPKKNGHPSHPAASRHTQVQISPPTRQHSPVVCFDETCRPKFCTCPTIAGTTEPISELSGDHLGTEDELLSMKEKLERLGSSALKEVVKIMKDNNQRSEFLRIVSPLSMKRYMRSMYAILRMVEVTSPGVYQTTLKWEVSGVSEAGHSNEQEAKTKNLILGFHAAGTKYLRRTMMLVGERKYRERFCVQSSFGLVDQYQECCWDLLDTVINNIPSLEKKKRNES